MKVIHFHYVNRGHVACSEIEDASKWTVWKALRVRKFKGVFVSNGRNSTVIINLAHVSFIEIKDKK